MKLTMKAVMVIFPVLLLLFGSSEADESDLMWTTFFGGDDQGRGIAVDDSGNAYVIGWTWSADFPTTAGAFDTTCDGQDAFVMKLNAIGSSLVYATLLGGKREELGDDIVVDDSGRVCVTGWTRSDDFPITPGAFDTTHNGESGDRDGFVAKLNATGSDLDYSTFLGGSFDDKPQSIALDNVGNACVAGFTSSHDFPTTPQAFDRTYNDMSIYTTDGFVAKLTPAGSTLVYATFLGGRDLDEAIALALDDSGNAYVTGSTASIDFPTSTGAFDTINHGGAEWGDIFVVKLNATGSALDYATFVGGSGDEKGQGIAVDELGNACVTGGTKSSDFPTTTGAFDTTYGGSIRDAYVVKLNDTGSALAYATYIGGDETEAGWDIAVADSGKACFTGYTESSNFPTTSGIFSGSRDVFIAKLNVKGSALDYSVLLGGNDQDWGFDIATDGSGNAYVTGSTSSANFPTSSGAFDTTYNGGSYWGDGFVAKLDSTGSVLVYSSYLAGTGWDTPVISETNRTTLPKIYALLQNHPNPFNTSTEISYQIPKAGHVTLKVCNTLGQKVRTLVDDDHGPGEYMVHWDGRDAQGQEVATGVYFCRLRVGEVGGTIKMLLLR